MYTRSWAVKAAQMLPTKGSPFKGSLTAGMRWFDDSPMQEVEAHLVGVDSIVHSTEPAQLETLAAQTTPPTHWQCPAISQLS